MIETLLLTLLLAIPFALLGLFVVLRNESFITVGMSHAAFGGASLALLLHAAPFPTALAYTLLLAILLHRLSDVSNRDAVIGVIFAFSMALGILSIYLAESYSSGFTFLFGSLLAISSQKLLLLSILALIVGWLLLRWKDLYYGSFDPEFWKARGHDLERLELEFLLLTSLAIVAGMKIVGALLVSAFLVIPPTTALLFRKPILPTLLITLAISALSSAAGVLLAYTYNLPPGAAIILIQSLLFALAYIVKVGA